MQMDIDCNSNAIALFEGTTIFSPLPTKAYKFLFGNYLSDSITGCHVILYGVMRPHVMLCEVIYGYKAT